MNVLRENLWDFFFNDKGTLRNAVYAVGAIIVILTAVAGVLLWLVKQRKEKKTKIPNDLPLQSLQVVIAPPQPIIHPDVICIDYDVGEKYLNQHDYPNAQKYFQFALDASLKISEPISIDVARIYNTIGHVHFLLEDYPQAIDCYNHACVIYGKIDDCSQDDVAMIHTNLGQVFRRIGNYVLALNEFKQALAVDEAGPIDRPYQCTIDSLNIGDLYLEMGDAERSQHSKALHWYFEALELAKNFDTNSDTVKLCCVKIASVYERLGNTDMANSWSTMEALGDRSSKQSSSQDNTMKRFLNTSGKDLVIYADSSMSTSIGRLYKDSPCYCLHAGDDAVAVLYKVSSTGVFKIGFTDYLGGVVDE